MAAVDDPAAPPEGTLDPLKKRKAQNDMAVTEYEHRIRKQSIEYEATLMELCTELKKELVLSTAQVERYCTEQYEQLLQKVTSGMMFKEHPMLDDGDKTFEHVHGPSGMRQNRILSIKYCMYEVLQAITESTRGRLQALANFVDTVEGMNSKRKDAIERTLAEMLHTMRSIAWADDEKCSVIVQDKGTDINVSLVANLRTILDLVGRLHNWEVSTQEKLMKAFAEAWDKLLDALVTALLEFLDKRMKSPAYMMPPERDELIHACIADLVGRPVWEKILAAAPTGATPNAGPTSDDIKALVAAAAHILALSEGAPSRYQGAAPGGFTGLLRSTLRSIMALVGSLRPGKAGGDDKDTTACGWPIPAGTPEEGWLRDWKAVVEPSLESLQIAGPVDLEAMEAERTRPTAQTRIEEWQSTVEVFLTRLRAFNAEYMSRGIHREEVLNKRATTDAAVLQRDLQAVLQFCTAFPYPRLLANQGEVVLVDCLDATLTFTPRDAGGVPAVVYRAAAADAGAAEASDAAGDGGGSDESPPASPNTHPLVLVKIHAHQARTQFGTVDVLDVWGRRDGAAHANDEPVRVTHRFLGAASLNSSTKGRLHRLCDSQKIAHNFPSPTLLEAHMLECDELVDETKRYQQRLREFHDYDSEIKKAPVKELDAGAGDAASGLGDSTFDGDPEPEPMTEEETLKWMLCDAGHVAKWVDVKQQADAIAAPKLESLKTDSATFLKLLNHTLNVQSWRFQEQLFGGSHAALIPTLRGAAVFLMKSTAALGGLIDRHQQQYMVTELDFSDLHDRQEAEYAALLRQLCEAPNQQATTQVFKAALQVLQDIEVAYCDVKADKEKCLKQFVVDLDAAIAALTRELYGLLKVDDVDAPLAGDESEADAADAAAVDPGTPVVVVSPGGIRLRERGGVEEIALATLDDRPAQAMPEPEHPLPDEPEEVEAPPPPPEPKGKGKNAPLPPEEPSPEKLAEVARRKALHLAKARIESHVVPLQQDVFCLAPTNAVVLRSLRVVLVDWLASYASGLKAAAEAKIEREMLALEQWLSERLRQHQRRMPSLASQEYDTRMRAIMENEELRQREFSWIGKRMANSIDTVRVELENQQSAFEKELKALAMRKQKLPQCNNFSALGVHKKTQEQQFTALGGKAKSALRAIKELVEKAEKTLHKDSRRFVEEHCRSFSEGGVMSPDQIAQAQQTIDEMQARAKTTVEDLKKDLGRVAREQKEKVDAERKDYHVQYDYNFADLTFLDALAQAVAQVKGGVNVIIAGSLEEERRIDAAVGDLEARVKVLTNKAPPTAHTSATSTLREDVRASAAKHFNGDVDFADPEDGGSGSGEALTATMNAVLADILKKARIRRDAVLRTTPACMLIQAMDAVAISLYTRGVSLGLVEKALTFHAVTPFHYFAEKDPAPETYTPKVDVPAAAGLENLVNTFWTTANDVTKKYFETVKAREITRPGVISPTEAEHKQVLTGRIDAIKTLLDNHFDAAHPEYSKQVGRVHLIAPRVPNEVFVGLYNNSFASIADTSGAVKELFDDVYSRLAQLRNQHRVMVKECMTNPGNRVIIEKTSAAEARRHHEAVRVLRLFHGVVLREETNMAKLLQSQILAGTDTLFKVLNALVIPDFIVKKSDVVVGNHRSLKRLRLAKQRKDAEKDAHAPAATDAPAKPNPKAGKGKTTPDPGKNVDTDRPHVSYPGMPLETRRALVDFKAANPDTEIPEHVGDAKAADEKAEEPEPKGKAAAKAAPKKGGKAPSARAATPEVVDDGPGTSPAIDGPDEAMFKVTVQCRNQTSAAFDRYHAEQVQRVAQFYDDIVASERRWFVSWGNLVASLLPKGDEDV